MTAPRLSIWDQALINLAGWLACSRYPDPNRAMILDQVRRLVPNVNHDHPLIAPLAEASHSFVVHAVNPSSMELLSARGRMEAALAAVFMARGSQACAQIWPEENASPDALTADDTSIPSAAESSAAGLPEPIPPAVSEPQDAPSPVASGAEEGGGGRVVAAPDTPTATVSGGV